MVVLIMEAAEGSSSARSGMVTAQRMHATVEGWWGPGLVDFCPG